MKLKVKLEIITVRRKLGHKFEMIETVTGML